MEYYNDRAFKLFVILMQPIEQLESLTPAMKSFLRTTTYLKRDDPQLLEKLQGLLARLRD